MAVLNEKLSVADLRAELTQLVPNYRAVDENTAVFFDLDGTLFTNDARWRANEETNGKERILAQFEKMVSEEPKKVRHALTPILNKIGVESYEEAIEIIRKEIEDGRMMQHTGAFLLEIGVPIDTIDFSEFRSESEFTKQIAGGEAIGSMLDVAAYFLSKGADIYILTARGNSEGLKKTFAKHLSQEIKKRVKFSASPVRRMLMMGKQNIFTDVYAVNDDKFSQFWKKTRVGGSANKKAAVLWSFLKDKGKTVNIEPELEQYLGKERKKRYDKLYFYDDEGPNYYNVHKLSRLIGKTDAIHSVGLTMGENLEETIRIGKGATSAVAKVFDILGKKVTDDGKLKKGYSLTKAEAKTILRFGNEAKSVANATQKRQITSLIKKAGQYENLRIKQAETDEGGNIKESFNLAKRELKQSVFEAITNGVHREYANKLAEEADNALSSAARIEMSPYDAYRKRDNYKRMYGELEESRIAYKLNKKNKVDLIELAVAFKTPIVESKKEMAESIAKAIKDAPKNYDNDQYVFEANTEKYDKLSERQLNLAANQYGKIRSISNKSYDAAKSYADGLGREILENVLTYSDMQNDSRTSRIVSNSLSEMKKPDWSSAEDAYDFDAGPLDDFMDDVDIPNNSRDRTKAYRKEFGSLKDLSYDYEPAPRLYKKLAKEIRKHGEVINLQMLDAYPEEVLLDVAEDAESYLSFKEGEEAEIARKILKIAKGMIAVKRREASEDDYMENDIDIDDTTDEMTEMKKPAWGKSVSLKDKLRMILSDREANKLWDAYDTVQKKSSSREKIKEAKNMLDKGLAKLNKKYKEYKDDQKREKVKSAMGVLKNAISESYRGNDMDLSRLHESYELNEMARKNEYIKIAGKRGTFQVIDGRKRIAKNVNTGTEIKYNNNDVTVVDAPKGKTAEKKPTGKRGDTLATGSRKRTSKKTAGKKTAAKKSRPTVRKGSQDTSDLLPDKIRPESFLSAYYSLSPKGKTTIKGGKADDLTKKEQEDVDLESRQEFAKRMLNDLNTKKVDKNSKVYKIIQMAATDPARFNKMVKGNPRLSHYVEKEVNESVVRLYKKMREASAYRGGLKTFIEKVVHSSKDENLHENLKEALNILSVEGIVSENVLYEMKKPNWKAYAKMGHPGIESSIDGDLYDTINLLGIEEIETIDDLIEYIGLDSREELEDFISQFKPADLRKMKKHIRMENYDSRAAMDMLTIIDHSIMQ